MPTAENKTDERLEDIFFEIDWRGFAPAVLAGAKKDDEDKPEPQQKPGFKDLGASFDPFE